ncbi:MAG: transposase [Sarcina sp.]
MVKKREWIPYSYLHITARGNRRNDIFRDDADHGYFLEILELILEDYKDQGIEIAAYCLMTNHIHILIKTSEVHPSKFIGRLILRYTKYFNKKYNYIGRLFQDRYYSEFIDNDEQLLETSRYIHLNPYKARMVEHPIEYKWSSYLCLTNKKSVDKIVNPELILGYFKYRNRYKLHRTFIEDKVKECDRYSFEEVENGVEC